MADLQPSVTSPYGTDPAAPAKSCPVGYNPVFQSGYGWVCTESPAEYEKNFQEFLSILGPDGISVDLNGATPIPGMTPKEEAFRIKQHLQKTFGGTYNIIYQKQAHGASLYIVPPEIAARDGLMPDPAVTGFAADPTADQQSINEAVAWAVRYSAHFHWTYHIVRLVWTDNAKQTFVQYDVLPDQGPAVEPPAGGTMTTVATYVRGHGTAPAPYTAGGA